MAARSLGLGTLRIRPILATLMASPIPSRIASRETNKVYFFSSVGCIGGFLHNVKAHLTAPEMAHPSGKEADRGSSGAALLFSTCWLFRWLGIRSIGSAMAAMGWKVKVNSRLTKHFRNPGLAQGKSPANVSTRIPVTTLRKAERQRARAATSEGECRTRGWDCSYAGSREQSG